MSVAAQSKPQAHRARFLERTLVDIEQTLEQSLFAENIARQPGLLQGIDARVKIIAMLLLLLATSLSHKLWVIAMLYLLILGMAYLSKVPLNFFVRRVWLFIPFFTALIALPALFTTPGQVMLQLPLGLTVTQPGATTALFLLMRVGVSVSTSVLIILTTSWNTVLKALKVLYIPDILVLMLGMTYRYIYLLLNIADDMILSRKSRLVGKLSGSQQRKMMAATTGVLLSRSLQLSSEVYLAMVSRGFYRYPRTLDTFKLRVRDWSFALATLVVAGAAIWWGR